MRSALLGIDIGTTAVKAVLLDGDGRVLGLGRRAYALEHPGPDRVELDPEIYWDAVVGVVRSAVGARRDDVAAVAIASQGETLVSVDARGRPTRPAVVWLDNRAAAEAELLRDMLGDDEIYARTGQPRTVPTWPACKIAWLRRNEPDVFAATRTFLLLEDFVVFRLTGEIVSNRCLQSSSLLLDIRRGRWWDGMLGALEIDERSLPALVDSGAPVGRLRTAAAAALGLPEETVVVAGGLDQTVAAVGAGASLGAACEATGAALAVTVPVAAAVRDPERRLPCHVHADPGRYCLLAWAQTAGLLVDWARDVLFPGAAYDEIDAAAATVPAGADGLLALPHFAGAACPEFDPDAKGAFVGLTLRHTPGHLARALMEAVAFLLRANVEVVEDFAAPVRSIRSLGGGARSRLWLQIKADVLNRPVLAEAGGEAGCRGAAALAGAGAGLFPDLDEAMRRLATTTRATEPDPARAVAYDEQYRRYSALYPLLTPLSKPEGALA